MASANVIMTELRSLIGQLDDGARLPTVRDLMRRFSASQNTVQEALRELREAGHLTSQVGRGTFVTKSPKLGGDAPRRGFRPVEPELQPGSYLMLYPDRSVSRRH